MTSHYFWYEDFANRRYESDGFVIEKWIGLFKVFDFLASDTFSRGRQK